MRIYLTIYGIAGRIESMATAEAADSDSDTPSIDVARDELQAAVPEAAETLRGMLDADDERIQLRAAEAILDRAGLSKAKATTTTAAKKQVGGESSNSEIDDLLDGI